MNTLFTQPKLNVAAGEKMHALYVVGGAAGADTQTAPLAQRITLAAGARVHLFIALFDSVDMEIVGELVGDGAEFDCTVLYLGSDKSRMQLVVNSEHTGRDTAARMHIRGAALEKSHMDFRGSINIAQTGNGTDGLLRHEGLLLSQDARINALPGFEINTDNVQAVHSSAVHFVRPEQLFYLQSRGIEESMGKQMIVRGFLEELLAQVKDENTRAAIHATIEETIIVLDA